jgi:hypothetical protein
MCLPILLPCLNNSNSRHLVSRPPHSDACENTKRAAGNFPSFQSLANPGKGRMKASNEMSLHDQVSQVETYITFEKSEDKVLKRLI